MSFVLHIPGMPAQAGIAPSKATVCGSGFSRDAIFAPCDSRNFRMRGNDDVGAGLI